ncbi:MAG TPA: DUF4126 domain-containing protein [Candidatus Angelobacter sp.]|nr:DUF4126 domain-containing protein [Candidatus Angelobacter sp.]
MQLSAIHQNEVLAIVVGAGFASGLNVYATVATLGILARSHIFDLPPTLHSISSWPVIIVAALLFALEFVADKIPVFDLLWNALHTFIRVPIAALLAYGATQNLSPSAQILAALLSGAIALAAHGGKTAVRAAVTPSPEPFSNIALSAGEDVVSISLTWFATQHPIIGAAIVASLLLTIVVAMRFVFRALKNLFRRARSRTAQAV